MKRILETQNSHLNNEIVKVTSGYTKFAVGLGLVLLSKKKQAKGEKANPINLGSPRRKKKHEKNLFGIIDYIYGPNLGNSSARMCRINNPN